LPELQKRFEMLGGVPRSIFDEGLDCAKAVEIGIINIIDKLEEVMKSMESYAGHTKRVDNMHAVVHIRSRDHDPILVFASDYVACRMADLLWLQGKSKLKNLIHAAAGEGLIGGWRGHLFEGHCHNILSRAQLHKFQCRLLVPKGVEPNKDVEQSFKVESGNVLVYESPEDLPKDNTATYCRPLSKVNEGFDSLLTEGKEDDGFGIKYFSVTVSDKHSLKASKIQAVQDQYRQPKATVFFVVPDDVFDSWTHEQSWLNTDKSEKQRASAMKNIEQWALKIELTHKKKPEAYSQKKSESKTE